MTADLIPETKREAVTRALDATFGTTRVDDIRPLAGGLSTALVFRIVVSGAPYLLRVTMRHEAPWDPTRHFACMQAGAEAGLAPAIRYTHIADRVLITDFVDARPFPSDAGLRLARTIRTLHGLPRFAPPTLGPYFNTLDRFVRGLRTDALLPADTLDALERGYAAARAACGDDEADQVSSHNDLKPSNLLFDGARLWLIDWEAAFLNDRYVDLAVAGNFFVRTPADEVAYLAAYFDRPATDVEHARFYLIQQILHVLYAGLLLVTAQTAPARAADRPLPDFRAYHDELVADDSRLRTLDGKWEYGRVHAAAALAQMRSARFTEALACVAGRPSPPG